MREGEGERERERILVRVRVQKGNVEPYTSLKEPTYRYENSGNSGHALAVSRVQGRVPSESRVKDPHTYQIIHNTTLC